MFVGPPIRQHIRVHIEEEKFTTTRNTRSIGRRKVKRFELPIDTYQFIDFSMG